MNCLLLSMPGTPVIYYGDEIGMGDNIHLGDRDGVRTPMQWSPDRNGGFSRADPAALVLPTIMDPLYGYEIGQRRGADARSSIRCCTGCAACWPSAACTPPSAAAALRFLYPKNRKVLAYLREHDGEVILCVANVSRTPQAVELDLSEFAGRVPVELNGGSLFPPIGQLTYLLTLPPYGFYWFILATESERAVVAHPGAGADAGLRHRRAAQPARPRRWTAAAPVLERETLPAYLAKRRWFAAKDQTLQGAHIAYLAPLPGGERELLLAEIEVKTDGETSRWQLPLVDVLGRRTVGRAARPACPGARAARPARRPADRRLLAADLRAPHAGRRWPTASASRRRRARSSSSPCRTRSRCCAARPTPRSCG